MRDRVQPRRGAGLLGLIGLLLVGCSTGSGAADRPSATRPSTDARTPSTAGAPTSPTTSTVARGDLDGFVVVIDPGHNGANAAHSGEISELVDAGGFQKPCNTTGTSEGDLTESRANWLVANEVKELLEARGARVVLTRDSDDGWGPCVDQRGLTAERVGADVLVSIHADGADAAAHGFHVIRPLPGPTVTPARADASTSLAGALRDALIDEGLAPANYVGTDAIAPRSDIATVNRASVPAVMLESGNMHNPTDFSVLSTEAGRRRIARGVAEGVARYLSSSG